MSDENPENLENASPALRREALLPGERNRGLGTVAVVCTMAGVASGLALATTLMAMQVADSMSTRGCMHRMEAVSVRADDHGFLGIRYVFQGGVAEVDSVLPGTPAQAIDIQPGDHVLAINGDTVDSASELQDKIFGSAPGSRPTLIVERDGARRILRPTLAAWPSRRY